MTRYEMIQDFVNKMDDNSAVYYVEIKPIEGSSAPSVCHSNIVYEKDVYDVQRNETRVFLVLELDRFSEHTRRLTISMDFGTIKDDWPESGSDYGEVDKEIAEMLLPIYKKFYLDEYAEYFKENDGDCFGKFVGIRDGFSVIANNLGVLPWDCKGVVREVA